MFDLLSVYLRSLECVRQSLHMGTWMCLRAWACGVVFAWGPGPWHVVVPGLGLLVLDLCLLVPDLFWGPDLFGP